MGQGVGGEHLGAQDEEPAHQSGGERDRGTGEERVLHERVAEHRHAPASRVRTAPAAAVSRYSPNVMVVSQNPMGYGE